MSEIRTKHKKAVKFMKADQHLYDQIYNKKDITAAEAIYSVFKDVKRQRNAAM